SRVGIQRVIRNRSARTACRPLLQGGEANVSLSDLRIKICGITQEADAHEASLLGADAIGLNFYAGSPRCIDASRAASVLREVRLLVVAVGLFVNLPLRLACETLQPLGRIRTLQWYGDLHEPAQTFPYQLIAAFSIREPEDLEKITRYLDQCRSFGH